MLADANTQWYPSGNPLLICIIRTLENHWRKHTGSTLDTNNSFSSGIPVYTGV